MLECNVANENPQDESPIEVALKIVLSEAENAMECSRADRAMILGLCARVPECRRGHYLARLAKITARPDARGGEIYRKVVSILDRYPQAEWKNTELQEKLAAEGTKLDAKQVGNFAAYFEKSGRFQRLARGHYRDRFGNVFVTADDQPTTDIGRGGEYED
jgi:hypothetical protein